MSTGYEGNDMRVVGITQIYVDVLKKGYRVRMVKAHQRFFEMNTFVIETLKPRARKCESRCVLSPTKDA